MQRNIKIVSTGHYLPKKIVPSSELEKMANLPDGFMSQKIGIKERRFATGEEETTSKMGAYALMEALENAQLKLNDIDALICTSATGEQEVPYDAALILKNLTQDRIGIEAFDICSTCLSFITGLDVISYMIQAGRYKRVALVSSDIASIAINPKQPESFSLFGDGAAAVIIEKSKEDETSRLIGSVMETFPEGSETCRLIAGGSKRHPREMTNPLYENDFFFEMDGRKVFKLASEVTANVIEKLLTNSSTPLSQINLVIPHQASPSGMETIRKKLDVPLERWMNIIENHGNMIAASIPLALHYAIKDERIKRGEKLMLLGTSAGFSVGGLILEY